MFDAVGTLFRSRGTVGEIYGSVASNYGFHADFPTIDRLFNRLLRSRGVPIERTDWKSLVESVFADLGPFPRFDDFFDEVYEVFRTGQGWRCYPETVAVLESLKKNHFGLGVVSNFDSRLNEVLDGLKIRQFFDVVVTPHSTGFAKPDARIFRSAASMLGKPPADILFAGDDVELDFIAAAGAGLQSVLVDRYTPVTPERKNCIPDLSGVLTLPDIASQI